MTVLVGDCRDVLPTLEAGSVHCVVTSPPYWGLRDYGVEGQLGLEPTPEAYVEAMVDVFREVRRVLRDDATLWINLGDSYAGGGTVGRNDTTPEALARRAERYGTGRGSGSLVGPQGTRPPVAGLKPKDLVGIPWRVAFALQADGWYLRSDVVWAKPNPMPESVTDRPTKAHEYVFLLSKSARYWYDQEAVREPMTDSSVNRLAAAVRNDEWFDPTRHKRDARSSGPMDVMTRLARRVQPLEDGGRRGAIGLFDGKGPVLVAPAPHDPAHEAVLVGPADGDAHVGGARRVDDVRDADGALAGGDADHGSGAYRNKNEQTGDRRKAGFNDRWDEAEKSGATAPMRNLRSVWTIPTQPYPGAHFATFPEALAARCILAGCPEGGLVLDPFAGSGTVGLVAERLSRRALLIELSPEYAGQIEDRTRQAALGLVG